MSIWKNTSYNKFEKHIVIKIEAPSNWLKKKIIEDWDF